MSGLAAAIYLSSQSKAGFQRAQKGELDAVSRGNLCDGSPTCGGLKCPYEKNYKP